MSQRASSHLSELPDLFGEPPHRGVVDISWILRGHIEHEWVHLTRQLSHYGKGGHVQRHSGTLLQLGLVQLDREMEYISQTTTKHCITDQKKQNKTTTTKNEQTKTRRKKQQKTVNYYNYGEL